MQIISAKPISAHYKPAETQHGATPASTRFDSIQFDQQARKSTEWRRCSDQVETRTIYSLAAQHIKIRNEWKFRYSFHYT